MPSRTKFQGPVRPPVPAEAPVGVPVDDTYEMDFGHCLDAQTWPHGVPPAITTAVGQRPLPEFSVPAWGPGQSPCDLGRAACMYRWRGDCKFRGACDLVATKEEPVVPQPMNAAIEPIPNDNPRVYAFRIRGEVRSEDMERMAELMNEAFDQHEVVDMLLRFENYDGAETGASLDWEVIRSRFRSLVNVDKYVVVGAPHRAQGIIEFMGNLIPVDARTFGEREEAEAWAYLRAQPTGAAIPTSAGQ